MLQVTVPDGVGVSRAANSRETRRTGRCLSRSRPASSRGQVIQISAPGPMVMERTELSDASNAMVGTWTLVPSGSCCLPSCCGGASGEMIITESNQVQTIYSEGSSRCCGCNCGTSKGSGSRGVNDTSITLIQTSTAHDTAQLITTYTITSATRDSVEMKWDHCAKRFINPDAHAHGTMSWDLAAKTMTVRCTSIPFAPVASYIKTA